MENNENEKIQPDSKDLRDGTLLLYFKHKFLKESNQENFVNLLSCLLDSFILLPARNENNNSYPIMITSKEGEKALPIFSNIEQMGNSYSDEDIDYFSMRLFECIDFLSDVEECSTLVLDPFTEPFTIDEKLSGMIKEMISENEKQASTEKNNLK